MRDPVLERIIVDGGDVPRDYHQRALVLPLLLLGHLPQQLRVAALAPKPPIHLQLLEWLRELHTRVVSLVSLVHLQLLEWLRVLHARFGFRV